LLVSFHPIFSLLLPSVVSSCLSLFFIPSFLNSSHVSLPFYEPQHPKCAIFLFSVTMTPGASLYRRMQTHTSQSHLLPTRSIQSSTTKPRAVGTVVVSTATWPNNKDICMMDCKFLSHLIASQE
jgi:hypothetical protein